MPWYYRPSRRRVVVHEADAARPPAGHPFAFFANPMLVAGFAVLLVAIVVIAIAASR